MKKHDEPDFYKLDKSSPLPDLVETQAANSLHNNSFGLRRQQGINGLPGGLHAGLAGSMTNALPQGFSRYATTDRDSLVSSRALEA
jgi:hypothetical protein